MTRTGRGLLVAAALLLASREVAAAEGVASALPTAAFETLRQALDHYEGVRAGLAADHLASESATRLAAALQGLAEGADPLPEGLQQVLNEAAFQAASLAEAEDVEEARDAFGEVSRQILTLTATDLRLVEGWHVFTCPMARTFDRWIQPSAVLENPYMGTRMLACGSPADWSRPELPRALQAGFVPQSPGSGPEPEFKPGIPGLKMVDVRDHKFLWRELDELQSWERGNRISVGEFRGKAIEKTAHFLQLEGTEGETFIVVATEAVAAVRDSFHQERQEGLDPSAPEGGFAADLRGAVQRVHGLLGEAPRHQLFAPDTKKWLLKLAFGPRERKEAGEHQKAAVGGAP